MDTVQLVDAVCQRLAAAGLAQYQTLTGETVGPSSAPPVFVRYFQAAPDEAILVTARPLARPANPDETVTRWQIQIRVRAQNVMRVDNLADSISRALTEYYAWAHPVQRVFYQSTIPLGRDRAGRDERSDNYEAISN